MAIQIIQSSDNGGTFIGKLNDNFTELYGYHNQSTYTDRQCLTRFIQEMNTKAALLGMSSTTFYDPVGLQPVSSLNIANLSTNYPQAFSINDNNVTTAMDALRMLIYASGVQHINDAWNIPSFTLNFMRGTTAMSDTIYSSVYSSSTYQSSIDALLASYDILGGKTGTWSKTPFYAFHLDFIARSKSTSKVYAVVNMSTSTANSASDNRFIDAKKALDYVDANGSNPNFSRGGCVVAELSPYTPSLFNHADITLAYEYGKTTSIHPASTTKIMTAILLCDSVLDLGQKVTIHEDDRLPGSGYNFLDGDVVTLRNLLNCMMTESSNTSAMVVARVVGGILLDNDNNTLT
ncbi:MAG: serine hydrolase [Muribaculaceae bacterium]|nr:serine hydrolase [Muribaculaceae bacterium]